MNRKANTPDSQNTHSYDPQVEEYKTALANKMQFMSTHDALTGLPNRAYLLEQIKKSIENANQYHSYFAILFMDLDRFKLMNESLGHNAGDQLLTCIAARLQSITRHDDILGRIGGDKFVLIANDLYEQDQILTVVNKVQESFQEPFKVGDRVIRMTASIGVSIYPKDGTAEDVLLQNADAAMYRSKDGGPNNFNFYTAELNVLSVAQVDNEIQLRQALAEQQFFLVYQPQFELETDKILAVEALIRWQHPEKGVILPIDFIPLAEEMGLSSAIGEWVIRTACAQNKAWQELGYSPVRIGVNVSAKQIQNRSFIDTIKLILEETGLSPEYLEIELTENVLISSVNTFESIVELKKIGVSIALDDFGTGYSSLSYLKNLPLDRLKIDGSFIKNINSEENDEDVIRAIIAMAKNLHFNVIAEGVENSAQSNFLRDHDCNEVQGFYFSKPLVKEEMEALLSGELSAKVIANN